MEEFKEISESSQKYINENGGFEIVNERIDSLPKDLGENIYNINCKQKEFQQKNSKKANNEQEGNSHKTDNQQFNSKRSCNENLIHDISGSHVGDKVKTCTSISLNDSFIPSREPIWINLNSTSDLQNCG